MAAGPTGCQSRRSRHGECRSSDETRRPLTSYPLYSLEENTRRNDGDYDSTTTTGSTVIRRNGYADVRAAGVIDIGAHCCLCCWCPRHPLSHRFLTFSRPESRYERDRPRIIIDSDLSLWWDDATAIGMANVLEQRGQDRILGIMSDIRNPLAVPAIDAIDTAYGHPHIPLGAVAHSNANTAPHGYTDVLISKLPHAIHSSDNVPGAVPFTVACWPSSLTTASPSSPSAPTPTCQVCCARSPIEAARSMGVHLSG